MSDGNDSILDAFLYETNTLLEQLDSIVLTSEQQDSFSQEDIISIFRIMHTIKGSSAMMEYNSLMTVAHRAEDMFAIIRDKTMDVVPESLRPELFDLLFQTIDFFRQELERVHAEAELQNLKSQLNPHFLFNTLNNIYSLIGLDAARAQQSVHELSRMLRYVLYDSSRPLVPLREEMDFLRNYVELMRLRVPRQVDVQVSLPDAPPAVQVAPLLFISLVENAFKHGVSSDGPSYVHISIEEDGAHLTCRIENSLFPKAEGQDRSGSGIGLKNLERRLELIYPGRHTFQHGAVGNAYMSYLEVDLW